ncbi:M23 family metallopeptidase [Sulfurovum sp.]|uniref:M23 family metallopeptidase n=1 Tax=Sulfurovum sp. TaxID=1969726 RepID=UPI0028681EAE|nr:M23 family metallopeptidase [Sulfurovum sp.]
MGSIKTVLLWVLIASSLFGAKVNFERWEKGKTFSEYLSSRNISQDVLKSVSEEDIGFLSEIEGKQLFYELKDKDGKLLQVLVPIGTQMQIRLAREHESNTYIFDIIPIEYKEQEYSATVTIEKNLHTDIIETLQHPGLANKMGQLFNGTIDAKKFKKGDKVSFLYTQKTRMGKPYDAPQIKIAVLDSKGGKQFIYADEEGYGYKSDKKSQVYTIKGKKKIIYSRRVPVKSATSNFAMSIRHARISSSFSYRRYHPILKKYRPHLGTDFRAKRGTPLLAVNKGTVSFAGYMSGYGKVVKIKHAGGYESLYAHQSRIRAKRGQRITKGDIIGYVGSTGQSTGPHLHFGLTKNGRWVNPMTVLSKQSAKTSILKKFTKYEEVTTTKYKEVVIKDAKINRMKLLSCTKNEDTGFMWGQCRDLSMKVSDNRKTETTEETEDDDV